MMSHDKSPKRRKKKVAQNPRKSPQSIGKCMGEVIWHHSGPQSTKSRKSSKIISKPIGKLGQSSLDCSISLRFRVWAFWCPTWVHMTSIMHLPISRAIFSGFEQLFFFGVWEIYRATSLSNICYRLCYHLVILNELL